ncbi:MAG: TrkA C-terminal domain-containing protein, partial [Muribaculaceae bacterium]|nr:TrkA C-terminal domain-containing protein [Muribaculaceae bacterium]
YSSQAASQTGAFEHWKRLLGRYAWRMVMYSIIIIGIAFAAREFFIPEMESIWGATGKVIAAIASLAVLSPFLLALSIPPSNTENKYKGNNILEGVPFVVLSIIRVLLAVGLTVWFISSIFNIAWGFAIGISLVVLFLAFISGRIRSSLTNIEAKFYSNLNVRELRKSGKDNNLVSDMHVAYMTVGSDCPIAGEKLGSTNLRKDFGVNIVSIQRGYHVIPIPTSDMRLFPGDQIGVVGTDADIERTIPFIEKGADNDEMSPDKQDVMLQCIEVVAESPLAGHSTRSLELRNKYAALLVAIQRGANEYIKPTGDEIFEVGDKLWVVGDVNRLAELK